MKVRVSASSALFVRDPLAPLSERAMLAQVRRAGKAYTICRTGPSVKTIHHKATMSNAHFTQRVNTIGGTPGLWHGRNLPGSKGVAEEKTRSGDGKQAVPHFF